MFSSKQSSEENQHLYQKKISNNDYQEQKQCMRKENHKIILNKYITKTQNFVMKSLFGQRELINKIIIDNQFFLIKKEKEKEKFTNDECNIKSEQKSKKLEILNLFTRINLSGIKLSFDDRLSALMHNGIDTITYLNLSNCDITEESWQQNVSQANKYFSYLKIIILDKNLQKYQIQIIFINYKIKLNNQVFKLTYNQDKKLRQCFEQSLIQIQNDKLEGPFNIYYSFGYSRQNYESQLQTMIFQEEKPKILQRLKEEKKSNILSQIKIEESELKQMKIKQNNFKEQVIKEIQRQTVINIIIHQSSIFRPNIFDDYINKGLSEYKKYQQRFVKINSVKSLKQLLKDIEKISKDLLKFIKITCIDSKKLYSQLKSRSINLNFQNQSAQSVQIFIYFYQLKLKNYQIKKKSLSGLYFCLTNLLGSA